MSNLKCQRRAGYTLIEILVAISVIGIVFAVAIPSYRDFSRRQALTSGARKLTGALRLAQEQALAGKKPAGCLGVLNGYRVGLEQEEFTVSALCDSIVEVKRDIYGGELEKTSGPASITFKAIGHGTDLPSDQTITLSQKPTGSTVDIIVTRGGEIR